MLSLPGSYQEKISHLGSSLQKFLRLKELDLSRNSLHSLEGLEHLKCLEKLNLYYNNIGSMKELERLRFNTSLVELDLRLNPITKEENDYRLFLIHIIPTLKVLDDRTIRESEVQMAATYYEQQQQQQQQQNSRPPSSATTITNGGQDMMYQQATSSTTSQSSSSSSSSSVISNPRVKSVTNMIKRSNGISDNYDESCLPDMQNFINMQLHAGEAFDTNNGNNYYKTTNNVEDSKSKKNLLIKFNSFKKITKTNLNKLFKIKMASI